MREQLIRYLLGELDDDERRALRAKLRDNPELQRELAHLRECIAANQDESAGQLPPNHLAERTAKRVEDSDDYELAALTSGSRQLVSTSDPPAGVLGWSLADLTVAGGVMLAVSMLVFPALRDSREGTRLNICKQNLAELGFLTSTFASANHGYLPHVGPKEYGGEFIARLVEADLIHPEPLRLLLVCPAASAAKEIRKNPGSLRIPASHVLRTMPAAERAAVTARISPCFNVRFLSYDGERYRDIRDERSPYSPVFSDAVGDIDRPMTPGHGGMIIQILYQDGHVEAYRAYELPAGDDFFRNDHGFVAAGIRPGDVVLAPSHATPELPSFRRAR
jgi:prepilin-type processing-associated H-X9-DG protein